VREEIATISGSASRSGMGLLWSLAVARGEKRGMRCAHVGL
jgi:hypothetical protein